MRGGILGLGMCRERRAQGRIAVEKVDVAVESRTCLRITVCSLRLIWTVLYLVRHFLHRWAYAYLGVNCGAPLHVGIDRLGQRRRCKSCAWRLVGYIPRRWTAIILEVDVAPLLVSVLKGGLQPKAPLPRGDLHVILSGED